MKELASEQVDTPDRERAEKYRGKLQPSDGIADERDKKGLDVDEETLAPVVGWVEEFEVAALKCLEGVDTIGSFVGIESNGDVFDISKADNKSEKKDSDKHTKNHSRGKRMRHIFFICFYATIIANYRDKEKYFYER